MNFVRGDKWKAASLGMQILKYCPEWKPDLYRETGLLYQDILDTARQVELRSLLRDTLYSLYQKAAIVTGDSSSWYLVRAAAALRHEDQSDSILGLMLEPAIRLTPMRCPVQIIEDYFRICDWQTRRGKIDTPQLEKIYQALNVILARQYVFKDSLKEKEQVQKVKKNMALRMARYLPDTTTLMQAAANLQSEQYDDWLKVYASLYARNVENPMLMNQVRMQLIKTGNETIWECRRLLQSESTDAMVWEQLGEAENDSWMKAWYYRQVGLVNLQSNQFSLAWQNFKKASDFAPEWGGAQVAIARLAIRLIQECPGDEATLKSLACTYFKQAGKKDVRFRRLSELEIPGFNESTCMAWPVNAQVRLKCAPGFDFTLP
jgi:hypothetical protein